MTLYRGTLLHDEPLAPYNTWRIGGNAKQLFIPADIPDLQTFLKNLPAHESPIFIGLGSNILIPDEGLASPIILLQKGLAHLSLKEGNSFRAEAGVTCAKLAKFCVKEKMAKGEFFAGIPGTVGGALTMNAGAFGGETWAYVTGVETIDRKGNVHHRSPAEFDIAYRSVKPHAPTLQEWFIAGHFSFPKDDNINEQTIKDLLKKRGDSQPIGLPSCGSVFKNPPGNFAAKLIEEAGLKGLRFGNMQISQKHANFIINIGGGTAKDTLALVAYIQQVVALKYGIELIPEFKYLVAAK